MPKYDTSITISSIVKDYEGTNFVQRRISRTPGGAKKAIDEFLSTAVGEKVSRRIANTLASGVGKAGYALFLWALSEYAISLYKAAIPAYNSYPSYDQVQHVTGSLGEAMSINVSAIAWNIGNLQRTNKVSMTSSAQLSIFIKASERRHERASNATGIPESARYDTGELVAGYADKRMEYVQQLSVLGGDEGVKEKVERLMHTAIETYVFKPGKGLRGIDPNGWQQAIAMIEAETMANNAEMVRRIQTSASEREREAQLRKGGRP